jgi:2-amino-4-hydroxy-6-hydroxymethyldihydropteridine diphosphokinase
VFVGRTCRGPHRVLEELLRIEAAAGRDRSREIRFGQRTLDLDLLTYGRYVIAAADLQIPHPRMHERSFVMKPLLEITPVGVDPRSGRSWESLVSGMDPAAS